MGAALLVEDDEDDDYLDKDNDDITEDEMMEGLWKELCKGKERIAFAGRDEEDRERKTKANQVN